MWEGATSQIGPRIRVGGTLGKLGQQAKIGVGKLAKGAAPFVSFLNPALGGALAAGGTALDTSKGRVGITDIAGAGVKTGGLSLLGKLPGASQIGAKVGGLLSKVPGLGSVASGGGAPEDEGLPPVIIGTNPDGSPRYAEGMAPLGSGMPSAPSGASSIPSASPDGGGGYRSVLDFLSKHKDDILDYGSAAEGLYDKYRKNKLGDEALGIAREDFKRRQPLRDAGMAALLDESRPDLSGIFADPENPAGRFRRVNVGSRL